MLLPNELPKQGDIKKEMIASYKLDGIRCIIKDGELLSRSLKPIPNLQLQNRFQDLKNLSKKHKVMFDGEIYSHTLTFQKITHYVMTKDLTKKEETLPDDLDYWCFDFIWNENNLQPYIERISNPTAKLFNIANHYKLLDYFSVPPESINPVFEQALNEGYEGLILRSPLSIYKYGRATFKSGEAYKFKPYETFDAKILEVTQRTKAREGSEKKINELGRSVTSKKKDDRIPIDMASAFKVMFDGNEILVVIARNDIEKKKIWKNRKSYMGRMIEYKGMMVGAKDVPRHPVFIRFRNDKD